MRIPILFLLAVVPLGSQTLSPPVGGMVLDARGLRSVAGVLGNLMPGDSVPLPRGIDATMLISAAFSSTSGAFKTSGILFVTDAAGAVKSQMAAPAGPALFSFAADGSLAWVCYPGESVLTGFGSARTLDAGGWGGAVVAVGPSGALLPVLVRSGSQLWAETVDTTTGSVTSQIPVPGDSPAIWFQTGWLVTTKDGLVLFPVAPGGAGTAIPMSEPVASLQIAGANSLAVNGRWLLNGRLQLLEIPVRARWRSSPPRRFAQ